MNDQPLSPAEDHLTRWLDRTPGAIPPENLSPDEASRLQADTAALTSLLRTHVPVSTEPPYPDFFNSQILKKIRDEQAMAASPARQLPLLKRRRAQSHPVPPRRLRPPRRPARRWKSVMRRSLHNRPVRTVVRAG